MNLFYLQLLTSFLVGGICATLLTIFAERSTKQIAGIIIGLPTTIPLGYVFISWVLGPQAIQDVAPTTPLSVGASLIFLLVYLKIASTFKISKIPLIAASLIGGLSVWFVIMIPFGFFKFTNVWLAVAVQLFICLIGHILLVKNYRVKSEPRKIAYTWSQKIGRAVFTGLVIVLATLLSKVAGPVWGGIFSGFPAVFSSTLVTIHLIHDTDFLYHIFYSAALGHLQCTVFIIAAFYAFPLLGILGGFFLSYAITIVFSYLLMKAAQR